MDNKFSNEAQSIAHFAMVIMDKYRHSFVDLPHILLAMIENSDELLSILFNQIGINITELKIVINKTLKQYNKVPRWYRKTYQIYTTPFVHLSIEDAFQIAENLGTEKISQSILFLSVIKNLEEASEKSNRNWQDYMASSNKAPQRISEEAYKTLYNYFSSRNITIDQIQKVIVNLNKQS